MIINKNKKERMPGRS